MVTIDEFEKILEELLEELPNVFFDKLNLGVYISEEIKYHEKSINDDLYVLGEYQFNRIMGRGIAVYYTSFASIFGYMERENLKIEMRKVLRHEFRHHIESLAGDMDLEIEDKIRINKYLEQKNQK